MRSANWWLGFSLALYGTDALAWGLEAHVFFAQQALLLAASLAPGLRHAALSYPRLLLAGALLPHLPSPPARERPPQAGDAGAHDWRIARRHAASECTEERAIAVGYASHLIADEVLRERWVAAPGLRAGSAEGRASIERAMDEHVRFAVLLRPSELLEAECATLAAVLAARTRWREADARAAIRSFAHAEARARRAPHGHLGGPSASAQDSQLADLLEESAREVARRLAGLGLQLEAHAAPAPTAVDLPRDHGGCADSRPAACGAGRPALARA